MTEDQIEREAERMMDALDRRYLSSSMSRAGYDSEVHAIQQWVNLRHCERIVRQNSARQAGA